MTQTTVVLIIDAGRADYVRPDTMPFLSGLAAQGTRASLEGTLGTATRTVLFTGRSPARSGVLDAFLFDQEASPYRWLRRFGPLAGLIDLPIVTDPARRSLARHTQRRSGAPRIDPGWMPARALPYLRPSEDLHPIDAPGAFQAESLFDLCRRHGRTYRYLDLGGDDDAAVSALTREMREGEPVDLYVAHLRAVATEAVRRGPQNDVVIRQCLRALDDQIASIHAAVTAGYDSWDLFVCGERPVVPVARHVDILDALRRGGARLGRDHVLYVTDRLAAIRYLNETGRKRIEEALERLSDVQLIDDDDRRRLGLPMQREAGDRLVFAAPGAVFWPNHFHAQEPAMFGAHGTVPGEDVPNLAVLVSNRPDLPRGDAGARSLLDVFPTICGSLDLPNDGEGRSLLPQPMHAIAQNGNGRNHDHRSASRAPPRGPSLQRSQDDDDPLRVEV